MKLDVYDAITEVSDISIKEKNKLRGLLSAKPDGYIFMPAYKRGVWDGNISLFEDNVFPSGLVHIVAEEFENVQIVNHCAPLAFQSQRIAGYELRDYQQEAVNAILAKHRGILKMATNAGKTLIMASVIKATGCKAVVVVPNRALLLQTSKDLEEMLDTEVGIIGAGKQIAKNVTVSTIMSLRKLSKTRNLADNVALFIDECHHTGGSATLLDQVFQIPAPIRVAMSGTPLTLSKLKDLKLFAATGPILHETSNKELIAANYSLKPLIKFHTVSSPDLWKVAYQTAYAECIVDNAERNGLIVSSARAEVCRGPVLIICNRINHAKYLHAELASYYATGELTPSAIQEVLADFANDPKGILICTPIFGEGVNLPEIASVILAAAGKSHIQLLQRIGRGLRLSDQSDGKLHVYDFLDFTNKYLMAHSEQRHKVYEQEEFDIELLS